MYTYANPASGSINDLSNGQYTIAGVAGGTGTHLVSTSQVAEIQPGQTVSVVLELNENMRSGRDVQFKLTTNNSAVFVGTVVIGQQSS